MDEIEEGIAAVEEDGVRLLHVPLWLLPSAARAGAIFAVEREAREVGASVVRITVDEAATGEALHRSQRRRRAGGDAGGDINL